jgi:hypothetical protein
VRAEGSGIPTCRNSARRSCLSNRILPTLLLPSTTTPNDEVDLASRAFLHSLASDYRMLLGEHAAFGALLRTTSASHLAALLYAMSRYHLSHPLSHNAMCPNSHLKVSPLKLVRDRYAQRCNRTKGPNHQGRTIKSLQPTPDGLSAVILKADRYSDSPLNPVHESINKSVIYSLVDNDPRHCGYKVSSR